MVAGFDRLNDRTCFMRTQLDNKKLTFISAYAPTLITSTKDPKQREDFYDDLNSFIEKEKTGTLLFIGGDFNAKTGTSNSIHPEVVGKFGKGLTNENGEHLIDMCASNKLLLTNTIFQHKMAHRTTWESPGIHENRRNPYRNQIDYVIVRQQHKLLIKNSRSYSGTNTFTDHRLVKTEIIAKWHKLKKTNTRRYLAIDRLRDNELSKKYHDNVKVKIQQK